MKTYSAKPLISLLKKGDLNSIRQAAKYIYNKETGKFMDLASGEVLKLHKLIKISFSNSFKKNCL